MIDNKYYNPYLLHEITKELAATNKALTIDDLINIINTDNLKETDLKNLKLRIYFTLRTLLKNNNVKRERLKVLNKSLFFYQINN